ncbi:peptidylprolyl isomerase [Blastopirellula marina]|uniref:peptidylprolyl isomerase n=1 Tax=Blastopirellula marina TaxID=124 RepID=UPI001E519A6C|nr:peptidylprolyl isomerase [Blastopirellula marina]
MPARYLWMAILTCCFVPLTALAQAPAEAPPAAEAPQGEQDQFDKLLTEWKGIIAELRTIQQQYRLAPEGQLPELRKQYNQVLAKGMDLLPQIEKAAITRLEANKEDKDATMFLYKIVTDAVERDDYQKAYKLIHVLKEGGFDENQLLAPQVLAAYGTDHFEEAAKAFELIRERQIPAGDRVAQAGFTAADEQKKWVREEELRKKEAEADDLPRVKLTTTQGDLVIELYENEAPETVGNFVNLVEKKYYDGLAFHRVLPHFMAQGGDPKGDGTGGPGYNIYCEAYNDDARQHFAGTLSMAKGAKKNTGGSQFFLTFQATPHLDNIHTVFGRVIEGMDVLPKITRRDPEAVDAPQPDRILKAEVIRKRNHKYEPHKVP